MSVVFTGTGVPSRTEALRRLVPGWYDTSPESPMGEMLRAIGAELDALAGDSAASALREVRTGCTISGAAGSDLTVVGRNLGVSRIDTILEANDVLFRRLIPLLAWTPKQVRSLFEAVMHTIYSAEYLVTEVCGEEGAYVQCDNAGPYTLTGLTLTVYVHGVARSVVFSGNLTAEQAVAEIMASPIGYEATAEVTNTGCVRVTSNNRGSRTFLLVSGTAVGAGPLLTFSTAQGRGNDAGTRVKLAGALTPDAYRGYHARLEGGEEQEIYKSTADEIFLKTKFSGELTPGDRIYLKKWDVWEISTGEIIVVVPVAPLGSGSATYLLADATVAGTTAGYPRPSYMYADATTDGPPDAALASDTLLADDTQGVSAFLLKLFNRYVRAAGIVVRIETLGG